MKTNLKRQFQVFNNAKYDLKQIPIFIVINLVTMRARHIFFLKIFLYCLEIL